MNFVDIFILVCLGLGAFFGFRKGVIKSLVQLIGTVSIALIAYILKDYLANFLMEKLPFFNFGGIFNGLSAMNILIYELLSFIVIYIVLYCILNIIISISGLIEKLLKLTIVLAIPSKILGAILGAIEGLAFAFIIIFVLFQTAPTTNYVKDSATGIILLERLPFMSQVMAKTTLAMEDINNLIADFGENEDKKDLNVKILSTMIHYNIISKEEVEKLGDAKKVDLENIEFS